MSLSNINIENLVKQKVDKFIEISHYEKLRQLCIQPSPLSFIAEEVATELNDPLESDKQDAKSHLTLNACKAQIEADLKEKQNDVKQLKKDFTLKNKLQMESVEHIHSHPSSTHHHPNTNTHTHQSIEQHNTHGHPESIPTHHQHDDEKSSLEHQKIELNLKLRSLQKALKIKQLTHKEDLTRINEINQILTINLPTEEQQRNERTLARQLREQARLQNDPNLEQLSQKNRLSLKESIIKAHKKLEEKRNTLIQQVNDISYQVYLDRLEFFLQKSSNLNYQEIEALKQIVQYMKNYLDTKSNEQNQLTERNKVSREKGILELELEKNRKELNRLEESNPQLESRNIQLAKENKELEQAIKERHQYRNKLLKIGLGFLFLTGMVVGGTIAYIDLTIVSLALTSATLFFVPAAVVALISVGLFIAALAYTIKNSMDSNQLSNNQFKIKSNESTVSSQSQQISTLKNETMPHLINQIFDKQQQINSFDKHIELLQQQAELSLNNAKNISIPSVSNQMFFDAPPPYAYMEPPQNEPSAPHLSEVEQYQNNSYKN
ncbi:MAG: hypothetical protein HYX60_06425 [Legionella longbeachae]|nr:hypothetical protein [Legionella longbeachae]